MAHRDAVNYTVIAEGADLSLESETTSNTAVLVLMGLQNSIDVAPLEILVILEDFAILSNERFVWNLGDPIVFGIFGITRTMDTGSNQAF